ncbi:MAG: glycosyl hydrolase 53 family protein [Prevotella sp.]|nr:glycosyl hydrolase 53 family protein [Prevotella sp.]
MRIGRTISTALCALFALCASAQKYVGGDISLLPTYEEHGANYMTQDGTRITNMLDFYKQQGWNAMRVRLFVDPSRATAAEKRQGVRQDLDYVKKLGKRIKDAGFAFLLDFHYSDTWADPSQQKTPYLFKQMDTPAYEYIYDYTRNCLNELVKSGATPDLIQTGNEISWGMLFDSNCKLENNSAWTGYKDTNWNTFTTALKNAGKACREVCPDAKIIIHTEQAANTPLVTDFYQRLANYNVDYDIIGTSYYPYFHSNLNQLEKTITQFESKFPDKQIMVVETGCAYHYKVGSNDQGYPLTYEGQRRFTADLVTMLNKHTHVTGLFWWFPEANEYGLKWETQRVTDDWYNASLFDNQTGRALPATAELRNFITGDQANVKTLENQPTDDPRWYTIDGRTTDKPSAPGIYIHKNAKVIVK